MPILVRRSNFMVPVTNQAFVKDAWRRGADAVTLDLEDGVIGALKAEAREKVKDAIGIVGKGGAEVFVRVNRGFAQADIEASVWPGLSGVVLPRVESPRDVAEAAEILATMEG
ncbi:MAG: aldolase/citrate lyase family protein, partial [Acidobacteriota bacterium]